MLVGLLALSTTPGYASTDKATVAKAELLLKTADERLANAKALRATYTETDEYPGEYRDLRQKGVVTLEKPGSYRLEIQRFRRVSAKDAWTNSGNTTLEVSNGREDYSVFFHSHSTQLRKAEAGSAPKLQGAPLLAAFFSDQKSPAAALTEADSNGELTDLEVTGSRIQFESGEVKRTIELGEDGLIHKLAVHNDSNNSTKTWTLDSVTLDKAASPSLFSYTPPSEALPYPVSEHTTGFPIGQSVPDFEVESVDHKPIHLSDTKGKVVVLEFWATWCWPCNQSIPETQRLVAKYRTKGVDNLLVSIKDNRAGFDAWVKKHPQYRDLKFAFDDPNHGQAYENFLHPTNPTLYVIGRDGRVILKTEGYTGSNPEVEKAIASAL